MPGGLGLRSAEYQIHGCDLDPIPAALLGVIEGLIGLREQIRHIKRPVLIDHHADADRRKHGTSVYFDCSRGKALADALGHD